jgi:NAD(P)H-dependent FMN reductase
VAPVPRLRIIIASTRPGRVGLPVGDWFEGVAGAHGGFEVEVNDLADLDLPFMDEPNHPRLRRYTSEHTRGWSAVVDASDAFVTRSTSCTESGGESRSAW